METQKILLQLQKSVDDLDKITREKSLTISEHSKKIGKLESDMETLNVLVHALKKVEDHETIVKDKDAIIVSHQNRIAQLEIVMKNLKSGSDYKSKSGYDSDGEFGPESHMIPHQKSDEARVRDRLQKQACLSEREDQRDRTKKLAVSAEPVDEKSARAQKLTHHHKSHGAKQMIRDAIQHNDFFCHMDQDQTEEVVLCMYEKQVSAGQLVIREGEPGSHLYVASSGQLEATRDGKVLSTIGPGRIFGDLAILYNCTRTASVKALTDVTLYILDRQIFQMITKRLGIQRHEELMDSIKKVELLKNLPEDRISRLTQALDKEYFPEGTHIIREGEKGNTFFIIVSGEVKVTQLLPGSDIPQEVRRMRAGDFFGEKALLGEEVRTASIIAMAPAVEVLTLDRENFQQLIGDQQKLHRDYKDELRKSQSIDSLEENWRGHSRHMRGDPAFYDIHLSDIVSLGTLGVGGFGRVDLVAVGNEGTKTYALKALKKKHVVDRRQEEHVFAERNIMMRLRSDWIVRLYKTFRDPKFVYMLMDVCLGGELWSVLRDRGHFDESTTRFYVACTLEALEYINRKNIAYRDLKPENCVLDSDGFMKLTDFGFAKVLPSGRKTWTFCGTTEYICPEIILNKGHDQAADYWALGMFICELLLGRPPFQSSDPLKTYKMVLKGVDALDIPNKGLHTNQMSSL